MIEEFEKIQSLINSNFAFKEDADIDEKFLDAVEVRVAELMESNMELFFNHLYRMDVDERKVHQVLISANRDESVYKTIARLIIQRQKKRLETKRKFKSPDLGEDWDEF